MTATGFSGAGRSMRTLEPLGTAQPSPFCQRLRRFSFRTRKKGDGVIRGKLRIRSLPGAFLILGVLVVVVGTAVAVAGYWPYRAHRLSQASVDGARLNGSHAAAGKGPGVRSILSTTGFVHSDRMKLLGPIVMGVGLFIFICANTMLYENRDRETQLLLAQAAAVSAAPSDNGPPLPDGTLTQHPRWPSALASTELNICCLEDPADAQSLPLQRSLGGCCWAADGHLPPTLLTKVLHHQETSSPAASLRSVHSDSCNSSLVNVNVLGGSPPAARRAVSSMDALPLPLIKLNNCLMDTSNDAAGGDGWGAAVLPRRAYSLSSRTRPYKPQATSRHGATSRRPPEPADRPVPVPEPLRKGFSSDVCLSAVGLASGGTMPGEEDAEQRRKHRSWPRLDLGGSRRYQRLEDTEDSRDRLLDKLGEQYSQLQQGAGAGHLG
ncbi:transmembrane protein 200A-like [Scleropages formosus]|uniref:transmembrane protein 200A-like n=1 Tax=Scleropages formosus TaxID=113540 RepID=UPI0010FAA7DF|nr:transmembrane protein 200A-like [Scleropages formosus]XP_029109695.1 transmembrane protein 200A-like [Scleropages formosus]